MDRDLKAMEETRNSCETIHPKIKILTIECDFARKDSYMKVFDNEDDEVDSNEKGVNIKQRIEKEIIENISVLVNNVGTWQYKPFVE